VVRSVREFVEASFGAMGLDWTKYVVVDQAYMRPAEVYELRGDASKARKKLGWEPKTSFEHSRTTSNSKASIQPSTARPARVPSS
jgi:GDPmannose 4,6-dehydratase